MNGKASDLGLACVNKNSTLFAHASSQPFLESCSAYTLLTTLIMVKIIDGEIYQGGRDALREIREQGACCAQAAADLSPLPDVPSDNDPRLQEIYARQQRMHASPARWDAGAARRVLHAAMRPTSFHFPPTLQRIKGRAQGRTSSAGGSRWRCWWRKRLRLQRSPLQVSPFIPGLLQRMLRTPS